jgi:hypothetical protein
VELGPCYIKAGQVLANRPDILRQDYMDELCVLQDDVPSFPDEVAFAIIEDNLKRPMEDVLSFISERPIAAASLGQVPCRHHSCTFGPSAMYGLSAPTMCPDNPVIVEVNLEMCNYVGLQLSCLIEVLGRAAPCPSVNMDVGSCDASTFQLGRAAWVRLRHRVQSAAGSTDCVQVYKGILRETGQDVAIKVQRPMVEPTIVRDLFIFRTIATVINPIAQRRLGCNAALIIDEFGEKLMEELDYDLEATNIQDFYNNFKDDAHVKIPWVRRDLTGKTCLVMEWIDGIRCTDPGAIHACPSINVQDFIQTGVVSGMRQLLEFGLFHGDPHPGNIFALEDGRIAYVDFGNVAQLSQYNKQVWHSPRQRSCLHLDLCGGTHVCRHASPAPKSLSFVCAGSRRCSRACRKQGLRGHGWGLCQPRLPLQGHRRHTNRASAREDLGGFAWPVPRRLQLPDRDVSLQ